jgi:hypothetical protein
MASGAGGRDDDRTDAGSEVKDEARPVIGAGEPHPLSQADASLAVAAQLELAAVSAMNQAATRSWGKRSTSSAE